jgi:OFA family oxalate/formate antiporter-like MFS transporter
MAGDRDKGGAAVNGRWLQLLLGVVAMLAISSPQYVWTLFVGPFREAMGGASLSAVQLTFALFSICQCGLGPLHGQLASRVPPRLFVAIGGLLVGASWIASAQASSLPALYLAYGVLSGVGTGFVYVAVIELMVRYFPDRRGFAVGMAAGSYGFGAILTTFPIAASLQAAGFRTTLTVFGAVLAAVIVLAALGMRRPAAEAPARAEQEGVGPARMLATPIFWVMFVMMSMVATGGLMAISQLGPIAASLGIGPGVTVLGLAALPLALTLDRIANGVTRPAFGWISDRIGRENTMLVAFTLEAAAVFLLMTLGSNPVLFVLFSALVFFGWGEIYSLFPSLQADVFGRKHAVQNLGWLLIGTAIASVLGAPAAALLVERTGSWTGVFYAVIALDVAAALMAVLVLAPLRRRTMLAREQPAAA